MLGMGLRAIAATAGLMTQRRRSPAKPDGLGGVASMLTGVAVILTGGGFCLARRRGRAFCWMCSEVKL